MPITQLMEWRTSLLRDGRVEDLARQFLFPMALFTENGMRALASDEALADSIRSFRKSICPEQMKYLSVKVTSVEIPRNGRFRVWSELISKAPDGPVNVIAHTVHFMRETPQGILAEMLECSLLARRRSAVA